jgi:hypothetical protein
VVVLSSVVLIVTSVVGVWVHRAAIRRPSRPCKSLVCSPEQSSRPARVLSAPAGGGTVGEKPRRSR